MAALPLDEEAPLFPPGFFDGLNDSYSQPVPEPRGVTGFLRDQALNIGAGTLSSVRSALGAVEATAPYMGVDLSDPELARVRGMQRDVRDSLSSSADELTRSMSPQGQREVSAKFLPGAGPTIWDKDVSLPGAIVGKVARSAPSVVASILGTVFGGPAVGYVTAGSLTAGDVFNDIREGIEKMPSEELAARNPLFAGYLTMMPEEEARERLLAEVGTNRALLMGTITAATSKYLGIEGRVASRMGGGAVGGRIGGVIGEAVQEGTEQVAQNVLTHTGKSAAGHDAPFDWHSLANETIEAMTIGGIMGGALGGGHQHARVSDQPIADDHAAALSDQPIAPSPVTPGVIAPDVGPEVTVNQKKTTPGQELAALDQTVKGTGANAGVVEHVDTPSAVPNVPVGLAPDEAAALNYQWDKELGDEDPNRTDPDMEPSSVPPPVPPVPAVSVVAPQMARAIGAAPVQTAVQPAEPRLEPGPGEPTQVRPPTQPAPEPAAAPALEPAPAPATGKGSRPGRTKAAKARQDAALEALQREFPPVEQAPVTPTGNVLQDVTTPEKKQFLTTDEAGNLKIVAEGPPRLGRRKKEQIEAGATEILSAKELDRKARADELAGLAERVRAAQAQFTEPPSLDVPTKQLRAYARALAEAAQVGDVKLANLSTDADPALRLIRDAVQVAKGAGTVSKVHDFIATDVGLRKGGGAEFTKSEFGGGVGLKEEIGEGPIPRGTTTAGAVTNVAEEGVTEGIDARRAAARQAELDAAEAARKAEVAAKAAAAMEGAVIGGAKRPVTVERKRAVTPQGKRENLFERRRREAEEKEAEAAAVVERTRKERETAREKGIAEMMALMQERDQILAGHTDFADAALPAQDMAGKIAAVHRRLETALDSKNAAAQAYRSAVQQHEQIKKQAAGEATARTPAEAVAQLQTQRGEENRDVLARPADTVALARSINRADSPTLGTTTTLGKIVESGRLFQHKTGEAREEIAGVHRLLMGEMAGRIRRLAADVPVHIVDDETALRRWAEIGDPTIEPAAFYDAIADEIVVRHNEITPEALIHEGLHAAYYRAIEASPKLKEHVHSLMDEVSLQWLREQNRAGRARVAPPYGLDNAHEFISEAFSNPEFQALLMRTPVSPEIATEQRGFKRGLYTVWDALLRNIRKVLFKEGGPSLGILEQVIRATQQIDKVAEQQRSRAPMTGALAMRLGSGSEIDVREALASFTGDRTPGARKALRRTGLKVSTFDQINRNHGAKFDAAPGEGNPVQRIYDAISEQSTLADDKKRVGDTIAQEWLELAQKHTSEVMERASRLWIDSTMANVNPEPGGNNDHLGKDVAANYQKKAQLARLQQEFRELPPEVGRFIIDRAKYFRDTQNEITKVRISNLLQTFAPTLSIQAYAQITNNTMRGNLTEEDAGIIDNRPLFDALSNASNLRIIEGLYFPLMRHGEHVVRTWARLGNLHGGEVVETDSKGNVVVEFRASKDKDARAAMKRFQESTEATTGAVGKRRYLPDGTRVLEPEARGQPHTVAYRVRVRRAGVQMFDTSRQAEAWIRENRDAYDQIDEHSLDKEKATERGDFTNANLAALMSSLNKRDDIDAGMKGMLSAVLQEASVSQMAGNRIRQRAMPRRNVAGASTDIARGITQYSRSASIELAKLRYMPKVRQALLDMRALMANQPHHNDAVARGQVYQEIINRVDNNTTNVNDPPQLVRDIMTLSMMDKLFSPMYSVVNAMQTWMVTLPVLTGHYGALRSAAALNRAANDIGARGLVWAGMKDTATAIRNIRSVGLDTTDLVGSVIKKVGAQADGAALTRLLTDLRRTGQLGNEAGFELAASISAGHGRIRQAIGQVERIARQLPMAIEMINRATTAVSTYRLGRSAGMTEEQAAAHARDMVDRTQFNYATANQPNVFRHPLASPILQFKKYAQNMTALMVGMTKQLATGTRQEKQVAFKQLMAVLSVQMAMAGAMGLPGLELLKAGFMIASLLGAGDGWDDVERRLRKTFNDALGKTGGELVSRGILARGIAQFIPFPDLSTRVSLADMWLWGEPKSNDREGAKAYLFNLAGGAPAALLLDWMEAIKHAGRGEGQDFLIKAIPNKFISDTLKATKGRLNRDITDAEFVIQALGARSARMAEEGETKGEAIAINKKLEEERKELTRQYINATSQGELLKLKARILAHNAQAKETNHPRQSVGTKGLDAIRAKEKARRDKIQGE